MADEFLPAGLQQIWAAAAPYLNVIYPTFSSILPEIVLMTLSIFAYAVIVYHFYRFLAKRDVFQIRMHKYKRSEGGIANKILNTILGTIEYLLFFPIVVFLWFVGFSLMLFLIAKNLELEQILLVSVVFVASIRSASYYTENLSQDLAKMIPFALLGVAIIDPSFFSVGLFFERAYSIPGSLLKIVAYLVFILLLEWALRILLFFKRLAFKSREEETAA